jgi:ubiquinone/menaquinone biosynthesis C-methylase UbiE
MTEIRTSESDDNSTDVYSREALHHDEWANSVDIASVDIDAVWQGTGCPEVRWITNQLGDVKGLRVLDLGSGLGEATVWFARAGAQVTALDISPGMLKVVEQVADRYCVSVTTVVGSATDLSGFPDATFDIVYGANVLHHVDIDVCLDEVRRVLKPNGRAAFWDPVKYNPVIEIYRRLASGVRTEDEHPLRRRDLRAMQLRFTSVTEQGFWLTALVLFVRFFVIDRIPPSADRYWKLAIDRQDKHHTFLQAAHRVDRVLLRWVPPLKWMCWNLSVVCTR